MTDKARRMVIFGGAVALLLLFLYRGKQAGEAVWAALLLSVRSIVPALLPSLMLSGFISATSIGLRLPGRRLFSRLFRLPEAGLSAFLLGALCGFPIGAKSAAELAEIGAIDKDAAAEVAALSANSGPAFIVLAVGSGMLGDARLGWVLYAIEILSAVLLGILCRKGPIPAPLAPTAVSLQLPSLPDVLLRGSLTLLGVTGTVAFFSALGALLPSTCGPLARALLLSVLEVGGGASAAALLAPGIAFPLTAFAICFSGVSVLMQSASHLTAAGIPLLPLIKRKIFQGILGAWMALATLAWI